MFPEGHKEKGVATWCSAFKVPNHRALFVKEADRNFKVDNKSNYMQNLTAALNFLNTK